MLIDRYAIMAHIHIINTAIVPTERGNEMTKIRYFGSINGNPVRLENVVEINGVKMGLTPDNIRIPADRKVAYKSSPSRHQCDDRCVHAKGRIMKCECACGGLNHGKGAGMAIMF